MWDSLNNMTIRNEYYQKLVSLPWTEPICQLLTKIIQKLLASNDADVVLCKDLFHSSCHGAACELQVGDILQTLHTGQRPK